MLLLGLNSPSRGVRRIAAVRRISNHQVPAVERQTVPLTFARTPMRGLIRLPGAARALAGLRVLQTYGEPLLKLDVALMRSCLPASCFIRSTYGATESSGLSWFADEPDSHHPVRRNGNADARHRSDDRGR
jgi:acyl-coenzyme A synthetase/AMP-(fatty) acid ligase